MKFKDLLVPLSLALLTTFIIHHFVLKKVVPDNSGERTVVSSGKQIVPKNLEVVRPLNFEIDFVDDKKKGEKPSLTEIETPFGKYVFSSFGASLERVEFKHDVNKKRESLGTIFPMAEEDRERRCFLVALPEKTPYYYKLIGFENKDDAAVVTYQADSEVASIKKTFVVQKSDYQIHLDLEVIPKSAEDKNLDVRVLFPSPIFPSIEANDEFSVFVGTGIDSIENKKFSDENWLQTCWDKPSLFGMEDRYFVHAFVGGQKSFASRAYVNALSPTRFISILEGSVNKEKTSNRLSFYFGLKDGSAMAAVSPALEKTLNYGWLYWPAKGILWVLKEINKYTNSFGWAIILFCLFLQILLWPFNPYDEKKTKKRNEMQQKLAYVKKAYKNDPKLQAQKQKEVIQKYGMGGMTGGCLILFLQVPLFIGLRYVLNGAIEMYHAPFLWINDLASADPYYILPILTAIGMLLSTLSTVDSKQRFMGIAFSLFGVAIFASFSAGLNLFIFVSTFFRFAQTKVQKLISK